MARSVVQLEMTLAIPFDEKIGYCCPGCLSVGVGSKWVQGTNYCPKCGQHIKLMNEKDWKDLLNDVNRIPDVLKTNIVTTQIDFSQGFSQSKRTINGVFLERLRAWKNNDEQIEGQMSIFDVQKEGQ